MLPFLRPVILLSLCKIICNISVHIVLFGSVITCKSTSGILLLCLALQLYSTFFAHEQLLPVYNFRKPEGLRTEEIRSRVVRDNQGYIWIGTANGSNRYDSYSVSEYRHDQADPHALLSNAVMSLFIDNKNRLWVRTWQTGLSLY